MMLANSTYQPLSPSALDFERALASSAIIRPQLAKSLLGWEARKQPLAEGMETYYIAWQASHP